MGCFSACFGSSKDRRRRCRKQQHKKHNQVQPRYQSNADQDLEPSNLPVEQSITSEKPVIINTVVEEIQEEEEEEPQGQSSPGLRKKVTFDSNVKTYEPVSVEESAEFQNAAPPTKQQVDYGNDDQNKYPKQAQSDTSSEASSLTSSSSCSYPSNHRYQNCRDSDDEFDIEDQTDTDSDTEDEGDGELDYYDDDIHDEPTARFPFPSAPANEEGCFPEAGIGKPGQNARDRGGYVHPVLNPVENLTQWKAAKSKKSAPLLISPPQLNQSCDKENDQEEEPSFKVKSKKTVNQEQVIAVDASLSNWLSSSSSTSSSSDCKTTTPNKQPTTTPPQERSSPGGHWVGSASPKSFEDRPILGALTLEEIRQMSASNSPIRKSPGHSPDDKIIIGSVGSYWRSESEYSESGKKKKKEASSSASPTSTFKGIPNTTSKYREDKRVNWHSTPFETRLERALNGAQS